jgi:integrase
VERPSARPHDLRGLGCSLGGHHGQPAGQHRAAYRNLLRRYLVPAFGPMPLADLDAMAVRAWLAKLERDGVGASTRAKSYRLLSRILGTAIESGYLTRNPCTIRGAAAEPAPEMRFATVAEVAALADAIPRRFRALVLVTRAARVEGLRFHDLRHTAATLAVAAGASTRELMVRMGHSSSAAALRYQHVMAGRDAAIAAALDELIQFASARSEDPVAGASGTRVARTGQQRRKGNRR